MTPSTDRPRRTVRASSCRSLFLAAVFAIGAAARGADDPPSDARAPRSDAELRAWLENMLVRHRFTVEEASAATGLSADDVTAAAARFGIDPASAPRESRTGDGKLRVLPYPGGRHPRIGFLDGAVRPQRETKVSVFTPWDPASYFVADVPEAIWSNLGLTYLAHTHVPTIWTQAGTMLEPREWQRLPDGSYLLERTLPNGIAFGTLVLPGADAVRMEMWLHNGTDAPLTGLRVQNCVMLKGAVGFTAQTNENKVLSGPYSACRSEDGRRWVITAWDPVDRAWANEQCPCLHSDPRFADCAPGETSRLRGWLSFHEGEDIEAELRRIEATGWREAPFVHTSRRAVTVRVVDAETQALLPARVHVEDESGAPLHVASADPAGSAVEYRRERAFPTRRCVEVHTTVSAHPVRVDVPPGRYSLRVEHGKEYHVETREVVVAGEPVELEIPLRRWSRVGDDGWYSGDTHVHRSLIELPNVILAEDLNVALPLEYWVRTSDTPPSRGDLNAAVPPRPELIRVDATHVIWPVNTEYEIFETRGKRHTLGAVFVLGHREALTLPAPPVLPIAREARKQGALLDLDKHSWPWSLMLVPVMDVDLFELANNHHWQTTFGFSGWTAEAVAEWMDIERDADGGFTERGWTDFGLLTYYALLDCGFRLRVTAGTASGVHPVPLGFGRVYVHLPDGFSYEAWMAGLDAGRSFVTTGPMLDITFDGERPGHTFGERTSVTVRGTARASRPLASIEIVANGRVVRSVSPANSRTDRGAYESTIDIPVAIGGSTWIAVRAFEADPDRRVRFAHTNPVFVDVEGEPLRPRREEVDYLIRRMEEEIARNDLLLTPEELGEYRQALERYREIARRAR